MTRADEVVPERTDEDAEIIGGLIEHARAMSSLVQPGNGEYHLRTLLKVRDWAFTQQPHQPGAAVKLRRTLDIDRGSGWYPYRDLLVEGAPGVVEKIIFNGSHNKWQAFVRFDAGTGLFSLDPEELEARCDC